MKARPILFSAPMVLALIEGRKTQTRRTLPTAIADHCSALADVEDDDLTSDQVIGIRWGQAEDDDGKQSKPQWLLYCADYPQEGVIPIGALKGNVGYLLWVRERFCFAEKIMSLVKTPCYHADEGEINKELKWKPSIHMPRRASRLTLRITDVRVQRLQEISDTDAIAEGIERIGGDASCCPWRNYRIGKKDEMSMHCSAPTRSYMTLWESINGAGAWAANPWVVALTFDVIKKNVDQVLMEAA